jgi:hypothetical protein
MIFFQANIFTNLRKCYLQLDTFYIFIFISKIWPINPRDGCKPSSNLVELIENYLDFEKELEEFEDSFVIMKLWTYEMLEE